jgi:hypothetical protein
VDDSRIRLDSGAQNVNVLTDDVVENDTLL